MRGNFYALSREYLFAYRACDAQGSRQPAGKLPAAASVVRAAVFDERGVVRMGRTRDIFHVFVVRRTDVAVAYYRAERRARGSAAEQTAQKFRPVLLFSRSAPRLAAHSAAHELHYLLLVYRFARGQSLNNNSDCARVRFAEHRELYVLSVFR